MLLIFSTPIGLREARLIVGGMEMIMFFSACAKRIVGNLWAGNIAIEVSQWSGMVC
jgi:hypothetical protein